MRFLLKLNASNVVLKELVRAVLLQAGAFKGSLIFANLQLRAKDLAALNQKALAGSNPGLVSLMYLEIGTHCQTRPDQLSV